MLTVALFWFICAIAAATIANARGTKDGGAVAYFIGGLVFGPIAVLMACVMPTRSQVYAANVKTTSCPHCLSEIPAAASACRYCQRDVRPAIDA